MTIKSKFILASLIILMTSFFFAEKKKIYTLQISEQNYSIEDFRSSFNCEIPLYNVKEDSAMVDDLNELKNQGFELSSGNTFYLINLKDQNGEEIQSVKLQYGQKEEIAKKWFGYISKKCW